MKSKDSPYVSGRSIFLKKVLNYSKLVCSIYGIRKEKFGVYLNYLNGEYAGMIEL